MGAVDGQQIHFALHHFLRALEEVAGGADGRAHPQPALRIFGRVGILQFFLNVFDRDQALEVVVVVNHQQFFHAVFVQNVLRVFERGSHRDGDEIFLGHHFADGNVEAGLKAQIAIGENAHQFSVLGDGHAGNFVLAHDFERVRNLGVRRHGDRIDDHAAFRALHFVHFVGLLLRRQVAMDDPDAALLGQRNRHVRFRDRVHGGADDGNVQPDIARELGLSVGQGGNDVGARGQQQHVVEGERLRDRKMNHKFSRTWRISFPF